MELCSREKTRAPDRLHPARFPPLRDLALARGARTAEGRGVGWFLVVIRASSQVTFLIMDDDAPMSIRRDVFEVEVIKLLLQVAWADEAISSEEATRLLERALEMGLSEAHLAELGTYLRGEAPLPAPNLGLLKPRRQDVMREIRKLIQREGDLSDDESAVLDEIAMLLS
jgi:hypothetical protein